MGKAGIVMEDQAQSMGTRRGWQGLRLSLVHRDAAVRSWMLVAAELLVIVAWTLVVTRPYLNLDPAVVPGGREYLQHIHPHHLWTWVRECGWCALWNGSIRGGYPALADLQAAMLHPLVILTTLGWGVVNGSKLALVGAFFMAGLAQWWLGYVLGLGRVARTWSAGMAVAAGHLAVQMEPGIFDLVLSTAACALALPPLVALNRTGSRRAAVLLGVTLALAVVAGAGYMQIGLALTLPVAVLISHWERERLTLLLPRYALAGGLAILLAAPFLVPFFHFLPEFTKFTEPGLNTTQPLAYVPLNLVINDYKFYASDALYKLAYPWLYVNFIGWGPILLALWGIRGRRDQKDQRTVVFLVALALLILWISSGVPLKWLIRAVPVPWFIEKVTSIRYPSLFSGLAIPPILALAAIGLDRLLSATWPQLWLTDPQSAIRNPQSAMLEASRRSFSLDLRWLLAIPLVLALTDARSFGSQWLTTSRLDPGVRRVLEALRTPDLQWVNPPFGEHFWVESAVGMGLKLAIGTQGWFWYNRPHPEAVLEATRGGPPPGMIQQSVVSGITISVALPGREYAVVEHAGGGRTVCTAHGTGGDIDVTCDAPQAGVLTVKENSWSGWQAKIDRQPVQLRLGQWLAVDLPAGSHVIQFRYRPWDVLLGLALSLSGVLFVAYLVLLKAAATITTQVGQATVADETAPTQVERLAHLPVNAGLVSLISVAAFVVALAGQYQLIYPHNLHFGLVLFGIGVILFLCVALLLVPGEHRPASARTQPASIEQSHALISATRTRGLLIAGSFALSLVTLIMIRSRSGTAGYWDIFLVWTASMALYLVAFLPRRLGIGGSAWRRHWKALLLLGLIMLVAFCARFYELGNIPQVMENDEGIVSTKAVDVLSGELKNMFQTYGGYGTMHFFGMALSVGLFGPTKFAVRLPSALAGVLTVPVLALLAYRLFGTKVALISAALLAVSHFHIHFSRVSPTAASFDPLFAILSLYLVYRGLQTRLRLHWVLAGLVMGIALYFYVGARLIPVLAAVFVALLVVVDRSLLRGNFRGMVAMIGAYAVTAAPMVLWAVERPDAFNARLNQVGIIQTGWLVHEVATRGLPAWRILVEQFSTAMLIFNFHSARWFYEATVPMLGPFTGVLFVLGLAYTLTRLGDARFLLLNTWFWLTLLTGQVLMVDPAPGAYRTMVLLPAVLMMAAVALVKLAGAAAVWTKHRERLALVAILVVMGLAATWNIRYYFGVWAPSYQYSDPNSRLASLIGEYLGELDRNYHAYIVGAPRFRGQGWSALDYLRDGTPFVDVDGMLQDAVRSVNPEQHVVFIFTPERTNELRVVEQIYPGGRRMEKYLGNILYFVAYEVR